MKKTTRRRHKEKEKWKKEGEKGWNNKEREGVRERIMGVERGKTRARAGEATKRREEDGFKMHEKKRSRKSEVYN